MKFTEGDKSQIFLDPDLIFPDKTKVLCSACFFVKFVFSICSEFVRKQT